MNGVKFELQDIKQINLFFKQFEIKNDENIQQILEDYKKILCNYIKNYHNFSELEIKIQLKFITICFDKSIEMLKLYFEKNKINKKNFVVIEHNLRCTNFWRLAFCHFSEDEKKLLISNIEKLEISYNEIKKYIKEEYTMTELYNSVVYIK